MAQTLSVKVQMEAQEAIRGAQELGRAITDAGSKFSSAQSGAQKFSQEILQGQQSIFRMNESLGGINQSLPGLSSGFSDTGSAMDQLVSNTDRFSQGMQSASGETEAFSGALGNIGTELEASGSAMEQLGTASDGLGSNLEGVGTGMDAVGSASSGLGSDLDTVGTGLESVGTSADSAVSPLGNFESQLTTVGDGATGLGTELDTTAAAFDTAGTSADAATTAFEPMSATMEDLTSGFSTAGAESETFSDALGSMNTEVEGVQGGLDSTNTLLGDYTGSAEGAAAGNQKFGGSVVGMTGGLVGFAGNVNAAWQSVDNLIDSQYNVVRANVAASRATESARKAAASLDAVMKTATGNADGIARARLRLADAMERVDEMHRRGISSGEEYEAATAELESAQAGLTAALIEGGVAADKAENAVNGMVIGSQRATAAQEKARIAQENWNESVVGTIINVGASFGTMISTVIAGGDKWTKMFSKMKGAIAGIGLATMTAGFGKFAIIIGIAATAAAIFISQYDKIRPVFQEAAKQLTAGIKHIQDFTTALKGALDPILRIEEREKMLGKTTEETGKKTVSFTENWNQLQKDLGLFDMQKQIDQFMGTADATKQAGNAMTDYGGILSTTGSKVESTNQVVIKSGGAFVQVGDKIGELGTGLIDLGNGYSNVNGIIVKNTDIMNKSGLSAEKTASQWAPLSDRLNVTAEGSAKAGAAITSLNTVLDDNVGKVLASRQALEDLRAVKADAAAMAREVEIALNEETLKLEQEEIALRASIEAASNKAIQQQELENATLKAIDAVNQFITSIDEERAAFDETMSALTTLTKSHMDYGESIEWSEEQLKQFIGVVQGSPGAIQKLGNAIQSLSDETLGWVEMIKGEKETVERVFGDWQLGDAFPAEIRRIMSDADKSFIAGRAQIERVADTFGPAIASGFERAATTMDFSDFQEMGPKAAAEIEAGFNGAVPPILENVVNLLKNPPGDIQSGLPWMQQVITEFENAKAPMNSFIQAYLKVGGSLADISGPLAASAEGFASLMANVEGAAGAGKNLELAVSSLNKVTLDNGQQFAQINGQLVELKPAAEGAATGLDTAATSASGAGVALSQEFAAAVTHVTSILDGLKQRLSTLGTTSGAMIKIDADIAPAAAKLESLVATISSIRQSAPIPIDVDITPAGNTLASLVATIASIKQGTPPPIAVNNAQAISQITVVQTRIDNIKQNTPPNIAVNNAQAISQLTVVQTKINSLRQNNPPTIRVNAQPALSAISQVQSKLNSLKDVNRTITYRYRTVGSPPAGARRYGGDFIMNSGGAQHGASWVQKSSRTLGGVDIGEFNKPELVTVTPLTNPSDASDRTIDIPSTRGRGGKGGGVSIGDTVVPVNIQIGNETIAKIVKRVAGNGREKFFR